MHSRFAWALGSLALIAGTALAGPPEQSATAPRLFLVQVRDMIDEGAKKDYEILPSGPVLLSGSMALGFLTRDPPAFSKVRVEVTTAPGNNMAAEIGCGQAKNVIAAGVFDIELLGPTAELEAAALKQKQAGVMPAGAGPLRLARIKTNLAPALRAQVPPKGQFLLARAFPATAAGACSGKSAGAFFAKFEQGTGPITVGSAPPPPSGKPHVSSTLKAVGYAPEIPDGPNCHFIIGAEVNDPGFKAVLEYKKISASIGTRFALCSDEVKYVYSQLPAATRAKVRLQEALQWVAAKYNWTTKQFQNLVDTIAKPLGGSEFAKAAVEAMMGQIHGVSPLTGDFNMLVDQGCEIGKLYVADKLAAAADAAGKKTEASKEQTESAKTTSQLQIFKKMDQLCDGLKKAAAAAGSPNDFLLIDHAYDPRRTVAMLRLTYEGHDGAAADLRGGGRKLLVEIRSNGGPGPNTAGGGNFPQKLLYKQTVEIPDGAAGQTADFPVFMDPTDDYKSVDWGVAYTAWAGARIHVEGTNPAQDLKIMPGKAKP